LAILLVQIPPELAYIDEARSPDRDRHYIFDHLLRYLAKFDPLPAIGIEIEQGKGRVVRGHKYLTAARILGRGTVRAVIVSPPTSEDVQQFLARPEVTVLDWEAIRAKEDEERNPRGWQIFYFERPLSDAEKRAFDSAVRELHEGQTIDILHDDSGPVAEFEANISMDEDWMRSHLATFLRFDREHVRIVSFQGGRFPRYD
jgi:hypothetical protein